MTILETSADRLMLQSRPVVLVVGLLPALLICAGIGAARLAHHGVAEAAIFGGFLTALALVLIFFVRLIDVSFDRPTNSLTLRSTSALGTHETTRPLAMLLRAEIQRGQSGGFSNGTPARVAPRNTRPSRPVLVLVDGSVLPLTRVFTTGPGPDRIVAPVNLWLAPSRTAVSTA